MYIHIGEDLTIRSRDIIAIVDKQSGDSSLLNEEFLKRHKGNLNNLAKSSFKSIIITKDQVYLSPYSSSTLKKRSNFMNVQD
jgi:extracellular matrix regulatory protein B